MESPLLDAYEFEMWMPNGRGRPRWDWFWEIFGVIPPSEAADACTMNFSWLTSTFGVVPENASEVEMALFCDQIDDLGQYSWGSATLSWLYRNPNQAS
ncbi:hypothetical protein PIB30_032787 [Stylosanthes scabra]|uniref:Aminotransferase-like plant mobile domain-containing protein n=1 Tax=Stylosanthes scabra TaxID=79078 RepID=A0ABU6WC50_9FABA|nr:hypothetical protein [Stylosanthes scabra]